MWRNLTFVNTTCYSTRSYIILVAGDKENTTEWNNTWLVLTVSTELVHSYNNSLITGYNYTNAISKELDGYPVMSFYLKDFNRTSRRCETSIGWFYIHILRKTDDEIVEYLDIEFEQHCDLNDPKLRGRWIVDRQRKNDTNITDDAKGSYFSYFNEDNSSNIYVSGQNSRISLEQESLRELSLQVTNIQGGRRFAYVKIFAERGYMLTPGTYHYDEYSSDNLYTSFKEHDDCLSRSGVFRILELKTEVGYNNTLKVNNFTMDYTQYCRWGGRNVGYIRYERENQTLSRFEHNYYPVSGRNLRFIE
jgi:hypothetical protein